MGSQERQGRKISTESVTEDSVEVRIDVEAPPGMELAAEDRDTRQIDTKPLVDAAFDADDVDPGEELGLDRPLFDDPDPAASSPEVIARAVRSARARQSSPEVVSERGAGPAVPPPERAFGPSVVVASQAGGHEIKEQEGPTVRRLRAKRRLPTGPHMPQAGSARWDGARRPLTGPLPVWEPADSPKGARRGVLFLAAGAAAGVLLGLGIGVWRDRSATKVEPSVPAAPATAPGPSTTSASRGGAPDSEAARPHALAVPGSLVELQRRLQLVPKQLEQLKTIREMLLAGDWPRADVAFSRLSPALKKAPAIRLWRARIDLFRGRAKEARDACAKLVADKLPAPWPAEIGLTFAQAEMRLGDRARAKEVLEEALSVVKDPHLKKRIRALLHRASSE